MKGSFDVSEGLSWEMWDIHIDSTIPHYRAKKATEIIKEAFPEQYLYESTPIFTALWRIARKCFVVEKRKTKNNDDLFVFVDN